MPKPYLFDATGLPAGEAFQIQLDDSQIGKQLLWLEGLYAGSTPPQRRLIDLYRNRLQSDVVLGKNVVTRRADGSYVVMQSRLLGSAFDLVLAALGADKVSSDV